MMARTTKLESMAARKINSLPTKPAVDGMPAREGKRPCRYGWEVQTAFSLRPRPSPPAAAARGRPASGPQQGIARQGAVLVYNDDGQPLAGTFMDYLLPTSMEVPAFEIAILDLAPSPRNPLGVKGAGEIGIVATGAALSNAVSNALGVQVRELPLSPPMKQQVRGASSRDTLMRKGRMAPDP